MSDGWGQSPAPSWDGASAAPDLGELQRPPVPWLVGGVITAASAVVIGALAVAGRSLGLGVVGWVLAGPAAIGLLAMFVHVDLSRRQRNWYVPGAAAAWLRRAVVVLALLGVGLSAWAIADVVARW